MNFKLAFWYTDLELTVLLSSGDGDGVVLSVAIFTCSNDGNSRASDGAAVSIDYPALQQEAVPCHDIHPAIKVPRANLNQGILIPARADTDC